VLELLSSDRIDALRLKFELSETSVLEPARVAPRQSSRAVIFAVILASMAAASRAAGVLGMANAVSVWPDRAHGAKHGARV
jgi:hypothetical protein